MLFSVMTTFRPILLHYVVIVPFSISTAVVGLGLPNGTSYVLKIVNPMNTRQNNVTLHGLHTTALSGRNSCKHKDLVRIYPNLLFHITHYTTICSE